MMALASFPDILRVPLFAALPVSHHVLRRSGEAERCCVRAPSPQGLRAGDSYPPRTDVSRSASDMITVPLRRHLALNHTTFPPLFPGSHRHWSSSAPPPPPPPRLRRTLDSRPLLALCWNSCPLLMFQLSSLCLPPV